MGGCCGKKARARSESGELGCGDMAGLPCPPVLTDVEAARVTQPTPTSPAPSPSRAAAKSPSNASGLCPGPDPNATLHASYIGSLAPSRPNLTLHASNIGSLAPSREGLTVGPAAPTVPLGAPPGSARTQAPGGVAAPAVRGAQAGDSRVAAPSGRTQMSAGGRRSGWRGRSRGERSVVGATQRAGLSRTQTSVPDRTEDSPTRDSGDSGYSRDASAVSGRRRDASRDTTTDAGPSPATTTSDFTRAPSAHVAFASQHLSFVGTDARPAPNASRVGSLAPAPQLPA